MIRRNLIQDLRKWRIDKYRKPLILRGARQVGKTTLVHEFGKEFDNYLYFNLENPQSRRLFEQEQALSDIVNLGFALSGKVKNPGDTLFFIDEIQNSPKAISLLRYFYEERPDIYVIAAGSLLENVVDVSASFPVGRVQYMALRPCSFPEFLRALEKDSLLQILENSLDTSLIHNQMQFLFNQYTIVGGMPEAVQRYAIHTDVLALDDIYETLLQAYRDDVEKYVQQNKLQNVVRYILQSGWARAGETITFSKFGESSYSAADVGNAFRLLGKAMLTELVYPVSSEVIPILPQIRRAPKLIWFDTGLVNYASGVRKEALEAEDIMEIWKGRIAEHIVAQEMLALSNKVSAQRAFWARDRKDSSAEVDFIYQHNSSIYPIEVKSGHNSHLRSLHSFMDQSPVDIGIRVWSGPCRIDSVMTILRKKPFRLVNLPFYLVWRLPEILDELGG